MKQRCKSLLKHLVNLFSGKPGIMREKTAPVRAFSGQKGLYRYFSEILLKVLVRSGAEGGIPLYFGNIDYKMRGDYTKYGQYNDNKISGLSGCGWIEKIPLPSNNKEEVTSGKEYIH